MNNYCELFVRKNTGQRTISSEERMTVDLIPQNALHARFEGKIDKGRPRLRRIDNKNKDIESIGPTMRGEQWT